MFRTIQHVQLAEGGEVNGQPAARIRLCRTKTCTWICARGSEGGAIGLRLAASSECIITKDSFPYSSLSPSLCLGSCVALRKHLQAENLSCHVPPSRQSFLKLLHASCPVQQMGGRLLHKGESL